MLELRPSRRKAAALERVRAVAEGLFWAALERERPGSAAVAEIADAKERRAAWRTMQTEIARRTLAAGAKAGLAEPVVQGLVRDITQAISSYIGLRANGHAAEWPRPVSATEADANAALDRLSAASTREAENEARDALARIAREPGPRPLTIARARDGRLIRTGPTDAIAVVLNVLRATDPKARPAHLKPGIDAATGEVVPAKESKTVLVVPVACSTWHEHKFLSGKSILRSSLIVRRGDRWFMCAQFEMPEAKARQTGARLGIDRGIINPVAMAAVRGDGSMIAVGEPAGTEIGQAIREVEAKRKAEQKRRGTTSRRHASRIGHSLHQIANTIVAKAKETGAQVVVEKLDGFKKAIVEKRPHGARRNPWQKSLKRAQLGKLEAILGYKLALAGLPKPREVVAGGTSITCPACAKREPKNRTVQAAFACIECGFRAHADQVGAINIARRDVAMIGIKRGDKLEPRERDMVTRLRSRHDGGLGPLAANFLAADGFVAARASADEAYDPLAGLTSAAGQDSIPVRLKPEHSGTRRAKRRKSEAGSHQKALVQLELNL